MAPEALRCSPAVRSLGVDPIGSALRRTSFLLFDHPLPWARDVDEDGALAPIVSAIATAGRRGDHWRLQSVAPTEGSRERKVVAYRLPAGPFDRYRRQELSVEPGAAIEAAVALVMDDAAAPEAEGSDLLVCTHGRRDACCGSTGTALWMELVSAAAPLPGQRICRTSHTGGHRFAPTAIDLPSGTSWAWLDADRARAIVRRDAPVEPAMAHYRGSCALASPAEQVVERAAFAATGWSWLDHKRWARSDEAGGRTQVVLDYLAPDGLRGQWCAEVELVGLTPVPGCPATGDATKFEGQHALVPGSLTHVPSGVG